VTQEELAGVSAERERLAPQVEEARWRTRQAEREAAEAQAAAAAAQQVRSLLDAEPAGGRRL
jgi:hypothetical protein